MGRGRKLRLQFSSVAIYFGYQFEWFRDFHRCSAFAGQVKFLEISLNVKVSSQDLRAEVPTISGNT